jgi:acyl carrier protein
LIFCVGATLKLGFDAPIGCQRCAYAIANHLGIDIRRVTDEAHFTDLGADGLDRLDLMIAIEERFADVEISDTDTDQIDVVGDLIRYIETLRNGKLTQAISDVSLP